jgi:hypothetical protein
MTVKLTKEELNKAINGLQPALKPALHYYEFSSLFGGILLLGGGLTGFWHHTSSCRVLAAFSPCENI